MEFESLSAKKTGGWPVYLVGAESASDLAAALPTDVARWAKACAFEGSAGALCLVPGANGAIAAAVFGTGDGQLPMLTGKLPYQLPAGDWRLEGDIGDPALASLGWLAGAYRFSRYRKTPRPRARLVLPGVVDRARLVSEARAIYLTRDLINIPANDLGPAELETAVRQLAAKFGAKITAIRGEDLLKKNFPMVHAVGRASSGVPRIVDFKWGSPSHPKITLVGKGVCFDSGGLNIKPGESMALMKKDMGGAANVLGLASMVMAGKLPVRLRVIIAAVENAISANAYRPGDVLASRKGLTVEIGNTDAEGRLILGDALAWGDEDAPEIMIDMATLTGAARVALGADLPALFTADDRFAADLSAAGSRIEDPMWRMPLWKGYRGGLSSNVADISHIGKSPFAGAVMAALFLERFVEKAGIWAHFDLMAWTPSEKPWAPVGGEAQCIRAIFQVLADRYPAA